MQRYGGEARAYTTGRCCTSDIYDVSKASGVSIATVSRVLNGRTKVAEATRQQVLETVRNLDYHPSALARSLVHKSTQTIARIAPDISNRSSPRSPRGWRTPPTRQATTLSVQQ